MFRSPTLTALLEPTTIDALLEADDMLMTLEELEGENEPKKVEQATATVTTFLPKLLNVALREISEDTAESNPALATSYPRNATLLLSFYCRQPKGINAVVPIVFGTLSRKGVLHPCIAQNINSIITAAFRDPFRENFTAERIKLALNDEVLHGVIRQLSHSTVICDMLLGIFTPAVERNGTIPQTPETRGAFAQHWADLKFPRYLAAYSKIAMADEDCAPYFYFLSELLGKALSSEAGTIVDELMDYEAVEVLFDSVLDAVQSENREEEYPLVADGLRVLHVFPYILERIKHVNPETNKVGGPLPVPLTKLLQILPKLLEVVRSEDSSGNTSIVGEVRYRILRLSTILLELPYDGVISGLLQKDGIIDTLLKCNERFPKSDILLALTDTFMGAVPSFGDAELKICLETGLIERVLSWRRPDQPVALRAHSIYYSEQCTSLKDKLLQNGASEAVVKYVEEYEAHASEEGYRDSKITGENFREKNSGFLPQLLPVKHRDTLNPRNVDTDVSSPTTPQVDDKAAGLLATATNQMANQRQRYGKTDWWTDDKDSEGIADDVPIDEGFNSADLIVDGKEFSIDDDDDETSKPKEVVAAASEDDWNMAVEQFEAAMQQNSEKSAEDRESTAATAGSDEDSNRPTSADTAEMFRKSGEIAEDDEDVMYMTPPATPPERGNSSGSNGAVSGLSWRPHSSDGLLPHSAGSIGSRGDDEIPPPPQDSKADDSDEEEEEESSVSA